MPTALAGPHPDLVYAIGIEVGVLLVVVVAVLVSARRGASRAAREVLLEPVEREAESSRVSRPAPSEVSAGDTTSAAAPPPLLVTPIGVAAEPRILEPAAPIVVPTPSAEVQSAPQPEAELAAPPVEVARPRRLRDRLLRTSDALIGKLEGLLGGRRVDRDLLDELETLLFTADLGVSTAENLLETVRKRASGGDATVVRDVLREAILGKLKRVEPATGTGLRVSSKPHVVLVLGVNGSGKTTTIGKLAARHVAAGHRVVLGAGDTFRAAAIEQLQAWGERAGADVIAGTAGGDPSAVAFDTLKAAVARGADVAIIDTAGRLQTKVQLVEELRKIVRVIEREVPGAPHESLLVLDSNTGQNAISQARVFVEAGRVSGLVLTKLDGTAKGGVIVGLADEFGIPVKYVGVGEGVEDLRDFVASEFVDALFGDGSEAA